MATTKKQLDEYQLQKLEQMKDQKIVCSIVSVSQSGMTRKMNFYYIDNNELIYCNDLIEVVAGYKRDKNNCIIVSGCGMDMIFSVLYNFNMSLVHKDGVKLEHYDNCRYWIDANNYKAV
jgi:hypothetical protein